MDTPKNSDNTEKIICNKCHKILGEIIKHHQEEHGFPEDWARTGAIDE